MTTRLPSKWDVAVKWFAILGCVFVLGLEVYSGAKQRLASPDAPAEDKQTLTPEMPK